MAVYEVQAPDGSILEIEGPDNATDEQISAFAASQYGQQHAAPQPPVAAPKQASWGDVAADVPRYAAESLLSLGPTVLNLGSAGIKKATGLDLGRLEPAAIGQEPQGMSDTQRAVRNIAGAGLTAPLGGPLRAAGANSLTGAAAAGVGETVTAATDSPTAGLVASLAAPAGLQRGAAALSKPKMTPQEMEITRIAREQGYSLPPEQTNPSLVNTTLTRLAGREQLERAASLKNQKVTNRMAGEDIGVEGDLTPAKVAQAKQVHTDVYGEVGGLSDDAQVALEGWKKANFEKNQQFTHYQKSGDPKAAERATAAKDESEYYFSELLNEAIKSGRPELAGKLQQARVELAKIGTLERSMGVTGNVSAPTLGRRVDAGKPTSGNMGDVGRTQQMYPRAMREAESVPPPDSNAGLMVGGLGGLGFLAGGPIGATLGLLPVARSGLRGVLNSRAYQATMGDPRNRLAELLAQSNPYGVAGVTAPLNAQALADALMQQENN